MSRIKPRMSAWCAALELCVSATRVAWKTSEPTLSRNACGAFALPAAAHSPRTKFTAWPVDSASSHVSAAAPVAMPARIALASPCAIQSNMCFPPAYDVPNSVFDISPMTPVNPLPLVLRPNVPSGAATMASIAQWSRVMSRRIRSEIKSFTSTPSVSSSSSPLSCALVAFTTRVFAHSLARRSCSAAHSGFTSAVCHIARCAAGHRPMIGRTAACTT